MRLSMRHFVTILLMAPFALDCAGVKASSAKHLEFEKPDIGYSFSYNTQGQEHFCDFTIAMTEIPYVIKLTSAFMRNDKNPSGHNVDVAYIVEMYVLSSLTGDPSRDIKQVKVSAGRIISDVFLTDAHATKGKDSTLGAAYVIPSEGSLALFLSVMTRGKFKLAVDFENGSDALVDLRPTPEIFDPSQKWMECSLKLLKH